MLDTAAVGDGWTVWSAEENRAVVVYRPDVFDGSAFPAPCLPTLYLTRGRTNRRPAGNRNLPPDAPWVLTLRLEPDIERSPETYESKPDAIAGVKQLTDRFAAGEVDYRSLYQVPRDRYLGKLDELTGRRPDE